VGGVFYGDLAVDGVFVGLDGIAGRVAEGHDGAEGVVVIVIYGVTVGHLDHADRLVDSRAVDVFPQQVVAAKPSCGWPSYSAMRGSLKVSRDKTNELPVLHQFDEVVEEVL